ncbi:MAG: helix-turn-helix transcriptional regulator [Saprospiraceae bacterium]|nr:helix-turn-helix transcriptional regulator [Pyrinomonadaceae bacterium]
MQIEWKSEKVPPYIFKQSGSWPGVHIHRAHVMPGRMLEHTNTFHDINVAIAGSLTTQKCSATGKQVTTKGSGGNLCITPAGQLISARWEKPLDNLGISLDPAFVAQAAADNYYSSTFEFVEVYKKADPLIQHIGIALLAESESETPSGRLFSDSLIQTMVLHLLRNYTTAAVRQETVNGGLSGYKLRQVREFIDENLEEDLSLSEISAVAGLSQFHFARAFRKTTGLTPQQFLMQQRIERAKELLSNNKLPIVEISLRTGFKNQSHFTTLFRKFTKLTPKTWRDLKLA